jgi:hypothetical protein
MEVFCAETGGFAGFGEDVGVFIFADAADVDG